MNKEGAMKKTLKQLEKQWVAEDQALFKQALKEAKKEELSFEEFSKMLDEESNVYARNEEIDTERDEMNKDFARRYKDKITEMLKKAQK